MGRESRPTWKNINWGCGEADLSSCLENEWNSEETHKNSTQSKTPNTPEDKIPRRNFHTDQVHIWVQMAWCDDTSPTVASEYETLEKKVYNSYEHIVNKKVQWGKEHEVWRLKQGVVKSPFLQTHTVCKQ